VARTTPSAVEQLTWNEQVGSSSPLVGLSLLHLLRIHLWLRCQEGERGDHAHVVGFLGNPRALLLRSRASRGSVRPETSGTLVPLVR